MCRVMALALKLFSSTRSTRPSPAMMYSVSAVVSQYLDISSHHLPSVPYRQVEYLSPSLILSGDPRVFAGITKRTSLHPDLISTWFAAPRRFIAHIPVGTTPAYGLFWYVVCFGVDLVILFYLIYLICLIHGLTNASKCRSITTDDLGFRRIDSSRLPGIGGAKREMPLAGAWPCDSFDSWSSRGCDHSHWQSGRQPHYEFLFVNALIRELVRHAASIVT